MDGVGISSHDLALGNFLLLVVVGEPVLLAAIGHLKVLVHVVRAEYDNMLVGLTWIHLMDTKLGLRACLAVETLGCLLLQVRYLLF